MRPPPSSATPSEVQLGFDLGSPGADLQDHAPSCIGRPGARGARSAAITAAIGAPIDALEVLQARGATDRALERILRQFARSGRSGIRWRLIIDRRRLVLEYGDRKRVPARLLMAAMRIAHRIPPPGEGPARLPDIGSSDDPVRLPTRRWGYRAENGWRSSASSEDRDGANGFFLVEAPLKIRQLDEWAKAEFPECHRICRWGNGGSS